MAVGFGMKKNIFVFVGTRPEAVKMAPVVRTLREFPEVFNTIVLSTGQHKEMLAQTLTDFELEPDVDLDLMTADQSLAQLTSHLFSAVDAVLMREKPDMVLVQGDTTTVMVASVCVFYRGIPCGHVEAGLRSHDMRAPFPEEFNRRVAGLTACLHFAPTERAAAALKAEGVAADRIHVTGNTGIDALLWTAEDIRRRPPALPEDVQNVLESGRRFVLVTGHRRESFGRGFRSMCSALRDLAGMHPDVFFLYPVHLNPNVRGVAHAMLSGYENIVLTDPLPYRQFVRAMQNAYCLLTDSGGIQEEAPSLKKPVLVMRNVTERPEGIEAGCSRLVGTDAQRIVAEVTDLLNDTGGVYGRMAVLRNPYGDGGAAVRIAGAVREYFDRRGAVCA
jgi:UDP-N-acetylglucosamine 2-epimerase